MRLLRLLAGCLCIVTGVALAVSLGLGLLDPVNAVTSTTPVLIAMLPSVSFGIAMFAVGVWLIASRKSR